MPSPDLFRALFVKELRGLLAARALWVMLVILSLLTGYTFAQAVDLFSQASRTALQFPEMARGMTPLDGVIVPTFGALYLAATLLFPFVAIRLIGDEKQSSGLKLLVQSPFSLPQVVAVKMAALSLGWVLAFVPALSAVVIWIVLGGHAFWPELLNLSLGYTLYAFVIAGIAFFAAALTESTATAAILTLAFTLGSWVLDFAAGAQGGLRALSSLSLTASLRTFEHGLFALPQTLQILLAAFGLLALCVIWLHPGTTLLRKAQRSAVAMAVTVVLLAVTPQIPVYADLTEDRRNSFNPADERALRQMTEPLTITIYLSPQDSRLRELESNVLDKLRRVVSRLNVVYAETGRVGVFGTTTDDKYGLIVYEYAGRRDESRSNSPGEILPILHALAGQTVTADPAPPYTGYPLVADATPAQFWFYLALPTLFGVGWWLGYRIPKLKEEHKK